MAKRWYCAAVVGAFYTPGGNANRLIDDRIGPMGQGLQTELCAASVRESMNLKVHLV
jgi:hypothetical protein